MNKKKSFDHRQLRKKTISTVRKGVRWDFIFFRVTQKRRYEASASRKGELKGLRVHATFMKLSLIIVSAITFKTNFFRKRIYLN